MHVNFGNCSWPGKKFVKKMSELFGLGTKKSCNASCMLKQPLKKSARVLKKTAIGCRFYCMHLCTVEYTPRVGEPFFTWLNFMSLSQWAICQSNNSKQGALLKREHSLASLRRSVLINTYCFLKVLKVQIEHNIKYEWTFMFTQTS